MSGPPLIVVTGAVLLALCLASCERIDGGRPHKEQKDAPAAGSGRASVAQMHDELRRVEDGVDCTRRVRLDDDPWFWDRAIGFVCDVGDGDTVRAFVYRTPGSAAVAAREQGATDGAATIVADRLLVSGHAATVRRLGAAFPDLPDPVTGDVAARDLSPAEEDATFCVRAVSAHAMLTIDGGREPSEDVADLDVLYPGYADLVTAVDRQIVQQRLVRRWADDPLGQERAVSRLGPRIKTFCTPNGDSR